MGSNSMFATMSPVKLFFTAAIPGMISMFASSLYSTLEGVFIGQYMGEAAFAAINLAVPITFINFSLADLIGVGSSVPISIALGKKEDGSANNIFTCAVLMIFLTAILMGIILYFTAAPLVRLMGAEGELAALAIQYIRVFAILGPVTTIVFAMDNYLRICGYVRGSMLLNIFMSLMTIGLLIVFIIVMKIGVVGSALASSLSMFVCAMIAMIPFVRKKAQLRFVRPRFSLSMIRQIVACGSPAFLNNIAGRVTSFIMNFALIRIGGQTAVAAYAVLMYASDLVQPLLYGMCDSLQPAIGYNWGAGSYDRVTAITKCTFISSAVVSVVASVAMFAFSDQIVRIFVDSGDAALMQMSSGALRLFCLTYLVRWFGFAAQSFYSAIEKPLNASVLSICTALVFPVLLVFVLWQTGLNGLWLNMPITAALVTLIAIFMILRTRRNMKNI